MDSPDDSKSEASGAGDVADRSEAPASSRLSLQQSGSSNIAVQVYGSGNSFELNAKAPQQPRLERALLRADSHQHRFVFRARRSALSGREAELQKLRSFAEDPAAFLWWSISGRGGLGKSRLALEFCLSLDERAHSGWLLQHDYFDWAHWQPDRTTLIVVDYADADANRNSTMRLLRTLASRSEFRERVRVLLLTREEANSDKSDNWFARLTTGDSIASVVESQQYLPPMKLEGLNDVALWAVVEAYLPEEMFVADRSAVLADILRMDPARRPLFAALAGDALGSNHSIRQWDQERLLKDVLRRERQRFWRRSETASPLEVQHERLLAIATLAQGIARRTVDNLGSKVGGIVPPLTEYDADLYSRMVCAPSDEYLAPLEPDILGEFFVLESLRPSHAADDLGRRLLSSAMLCNSQAVFDSLVRMGQDFPRHQTVDWLTKWSRGPWMLSDDEYSSVCRAFSEGMRQGGRVGPLTDLRARFEAALKDLLTEGPPTSHHMLHCFWFITYCLAWASGETGLLADALKLLESLASDMQRSSDQRFLAELTSALAQDLSVDWTKSELVDLSKPPTKELGARAAERIVEAGRVAVQHWASVEVVRTSFAATVRQVASFAGNRGWLSVSRAAYRFLREFAIQFPSDAFVQQRLAMAAHDLLVDIEKTELRGSSPTPGMIDRVETLLADCLEAKKRIPTDWLIEGQLGSVARKTANYLSLVGRTTSAARARRIAKQYSKADQHFRAIRARGQRPNEAM